LYIKNNLPKSAEKVKKAIVKLASSLSSSPYRYKVEFVVGNKEYRSVTIWSYKIIYRVTEFDVRIVDIFHTSRNSDDLNKNF